MKNEMLTTSQFIVITLGGAAIWGLIGLAVYRLIFGW